MKDYLEFMPYLKDVEGSPAESTRAHRPFSGMELCYIVLNAIPYGLACAYWAKHDANHFPMDIEKMCEELVLLEPAFGRTQQFLDQINARGPKLSRKSGKNQAHKDKDSNSCDTGGPKNDKGEAVASAEAKHCARCAKYDKNNFFASTHNTDKCRRFDTNGNYIKNRGKNSKNRGGGTKNVNFSSLDMTDMKECFAQYNRDHKKVMKLLSKNGGGKKKRKVIYESESFSDSEA